MPVRPGRPKPVVRVCREHLAESPIRRSFNSHLRAKFDHVPGEAEGIDSEWVLFRAFIVEVAGQAKCSFADHQGKNSGMGGVCEAMKNIFWTASKRFWTIIRCLGAGKSALSTLSMVGMGHC